MERIKWIISLIVQLMGDRFSGTLMLDFHDGHVSRKYRRQSVEHAVE